MVSKRSGCSSEAMTMSASSCPIAPTSPLARPGSPISQDMAEGLAQGLGLLGWRTVGDTVTEDNEGEKRLYRQHRWQRPPGACDILLVRHAESAPEDPDNPAPMVDGQADPALDPVGEEQAELLADRLAEDRKS